MFTGLIEALGTLRKKEARAGKTVFTLEAPYRDYVLGESIAVDGACLSVTQFADNTFTVDASLETLAKTTLSELGVGDKVHLERALKLGDRMGGHLVSGHVDGIATVVACSELGEARRIDLRADASLMRFIAAKGSVCLAGVSLTVNDVTGDAFHVALIPITLQHTKFAALQPGARVNLEVDLMARYAVRWLESQAEHDGVSRALLERAGFVR